MFVRQKTSPNSPNTAVQVVASVRDGTRVRQKIVRHFGTSSNDQELALLVRLAELFVEQENERREPTILKPEQDTTDVQRSRLLRKRPDDSVRLNQLQGVSVATIGFHDVYGALYDELGFDRALPPSQQKASVRNLKHVVLARIAQPKSERATAAMLADRFGVEISLPAIYTLMDQLTPQRIENLKRLATRAAIAVLPEPVDVLLFDCTTLYFDSFEPDDLRQHGDSKDAKFKETQMLLVLVVSQEGLPLTYELVPGATFECHSVKTTLTKLKTRFAVRSATLVADRGMLSEDNIKMLGTEEFQYVVGARLKQLKQADQAAVLAWRPEKASIGEFTVDGKRLVVSYSPKQAAHDANRRRAMIAKLKKKVDQRAASAKKTTKALTIGNGGYWRFLDIEDDYQVVVNEAKVAEAARWDGLHGVYTSHAVDTLEADDVLKLYRELWQVEETFRVTKHDLAVRPVYHWKPQWIEAHVAIAFMCLTLVRMLGYRVKVQQRVEMSEERIRVALAQTQVTTLRDKHGDGRYALPMALTADAKRLYKLLDLPYDAMPYVID